MLFLLFVIITKEMHNSNHKSIYYCSVSLYRSQRYMFRHFYIINRQLHIISLLSYTSSYTGAAELHKIIIKILKHYIVLHERV